MIVGRTSKLTDCFMKLPFNLLFGVLTTNFCVSVPLGVCPVLCQGKGVYAHGACKCYAGWKGRECDVPEDECEDPTCSGNGKCVGGICVCAPGFAGPSCNLGNQTQTYLCLYLIWKPPLQWREASNGENVDFHSLSRWGCFIVQDTDVSICLKVYYFTIGNSASPNIRHSLSFLRKCSFLQIPIFPNPENCFYAERKSNCSPFYHVVLWWVNTTCGHCLLPSDPFSFGMHEVYHDRKYSLIDFTLLHLFLLDQINVPSSKWI